VFGSFVGVSSRFTGFQFFLHNCFAIADDLIGQNCLIEIFWSDRFFPSFFFRTIFLFYSLFSVAAHL